MGAAPKIQAPQLPSLPKLGNWDSWQLPGDLGKLDLNKTFLSKDMLGATALGGVAAGSLLAAKNSAEQLLAPTKEQLAKMDSDALNGLVSDNLKKYGVRASDVQSLKWVS